MKVEIADLEKVVEWLKQNTHQLSVKVELRQDRHLVLSAEDKYQKRIEIVIYDCADNDKHLLKPTIQKTEQL